MSVAVAVMFLCIYVFDTVFEHNSNENNSKEDSKHNRLKPSSGE